jgi:HEAT repeat protein
LLTMISAKDGPIKKTLCSWLEACNIIPVRAQSDQDSHLLALLGFTILGPMAKPAVPALINLLKEKDSEVAFLAASALGRIGPAASNAVPALIMNLDSQDFAVRYMATNSLRRISPSAVLNPPVNASSA